MNNLYAGQVSHDDTTLKVFVRVIGGRKVIQLTKELRTPDSTEKQLLQMPAEMLSEFQATLSQAVAVLGS